MKKTMEWILSAALIAAVSSACTSTKEKNTPDNLMIPDSLKIETKEEEKKDNSKNNNMMNMLPLGFSMIAMNQKLLSQLNVNINQNIEIDNLKKCIKDIEENIELKNGA